jgi:hypothetical protein
MVRMVRQDLKDFMDHWGYLFCHGHTRTKPESDLISHRARRDTETPNFLIAAERAAIKTSQRYRAPWPTGLNDL